MECGDSSPLFFLRSGDESRVIVGQADRAFPPPAAEVDCWSTSMVFNRGHRIRATVTSSNFPRFDVNPGTGGPASDNGPVQPQTNRIWCDAEHPSAIVQPVVAPKG